MIVLLAGDGDDILAGGQRDDRFDCGAGDDVIAGDDGNDTYTANTGDDIYRFGYGEGNDLYKGSADAKIKGMDFFVMEDDIKKKALWFESIDNDLVVSLLGSQDSINCEDFIYESSPKRYIRGFQADGEFLDYSDVDRLVSAMAAFDRNDGQPTYGVTAFALPESLQLAVNSPWQAA